MKFLGTKLTVFDVIGIIAIWIFLCFLLSGCSSNSSELDLKDLKNISRCYCGDSENVRIASFAPKYDVIYVFCKDESHLLITGASIVYMGSCLEKK